MERNHMLWTIAPILLVLWALGLVTSTSMGGLIHILLVVGVVMVLINLFQRRRAAWGGNEACPNLLNLTERLL